MKLTDAQYISLIEKIKEVVSAQNFKPTRYNSDEFFNSYTTSNCGLCNDDFTTKETAMWPKEFPKRKSMAYRADHHHCPFDKRFAVFRKGSYVRGGSKSSWGCYHTCYLFSVKNPKVQLMQQMVDVAFEYTMELKNNLG